MITLGFLIVGVRFLGIKLPVLSVTSLAIKVGNVAGLLKEQTKYSGALTSFDVESLQMNLAVLRGRIIRLTY